MVIYLCFSHQFTPILLILNLSKRRPLDKGGPSDLTVYHQHLIYITFFKSHRNHQQHLQFLKSRNHQQQSTSTWSSSSSISSWFSPSFNFSFQLRPLLSRFDSNYQTHHKIIERKAPLIEMDRIRSDLTCLQKTLLRKQI
jgi:hypothetical protein